jgi:hypothetical protein
VPSAFASVMASLIALSSAGSAPFFTAKPYCSLVSRLATISKSLLAGSFSHSETTGRSWTMTSTWPLRSAFSSASDASNETGLSRPS